MPNDVTYLQILAAERRDAFLAEATTARLARLSRLWRRRAGADPAAGRRPAETPGAAAPGPEPVARPAPERVGASR